MPRLLTMFACFVWPRKGAFVAAVVWAVLVSPAQFQSSQAGEKPVSFINEVVPVLTKAGCNAGVCHAKAGNGQNGFQLSLFGYEPSEDYDHIAREARGRRVFLPAPERSLLLLKPSGQLPHGGGVRLDAASEGYAVLREWIRQGARATTRPVLLR